MCVDDKACVGVLYRKEVCYIVSVCACVCVCARVHVCVFACMRVCSHCTTKLPDTEVQGIIKHHQSQAHACTSKDNTRHQTKFHSLTSKHKH